MLNNGNKRLAVYNLLYKEPPFKYVTKDPNGNRVLNVLIFGTGWVGNEFFKTIFHDGQCIDTCLNISVVSREADLYMETVEQTLPAIPQLSVINGKQPDPLYCPKPFAYIRTVQADYETAREDLFFRQLEENGIDLAAQTYIIISLGNIGLNASLAASICSRLGPTDKETLISMYGEAENVNIPAIKNNHLGIQVFGVSDSNGKGTVFTLARHIHYTYEAKDDERVSRKQSRDRFEGHLKKEFFTESNDESLTALVKSFTGREYYADSSLACAIHIPQKLFMCANDEQKARVQLSKAINQRNELFNRLIANEHQRWMAYMATRGYQFPWDERDILHFTEGYDFIEQANHTQLVHACMCVCSEDGLLLQPESPYWDMPFDRLPASVAPLDRISIRCYQALSEMCLEKEPDVQSLIAKLSSLRRPNLYGEGEVIPSILQDLIYAIRQLVLNVPSAAHMYQVALENATRLTPDLQIFLPEVRQIMRVFERRNLKTDYFAKDAQLIIMLPLILWQNEGKTATFVINCPDAAHNVMVPLLLGADVAYFFHASFNRVVVRKQVQERYAAFFKKRGENTAASSVNLTVDLLFEKMQKSVDSAHFLMVVPQTIAYGDWQCICDALNRAKAELGKEVSVIEVGPDGTLVWHQEGESVLPSLTGTKNLSAEEYIMLFNGVYTNPYIQPVGWDDCQALEDFFWKTVQFDPTNGEQQIWQQLSEGLFTNPIRDENDPDIRMMKIPISNQALRTAFVDFAVILKARDLIVSYSLTKSDTDVLATIRINPQRTDTFRALFDKMGNYFELLVSYRVQHTGYFTDVCSGVKLNFGNLLTDKTTNNEIDVIAIHNRPVYFSCKCGKKVSKEMLYEILSVAGYFNAIPVLTVSHVNIGQGDLIRAFNMGISVLTSKTLSSQERSNIALEKIAAGEVVVDLLD